jgi:hypothetical protein
MNTKSIFLFVFVFIFTTAVHAQQKYTISGTIFEKGSEETLPGVVVLETGSQIGTVSNSFGFYSITLPAGNVDLSYQFVGYKTEGRALELTSNMVVNIKLESDAVLNEVEVSAERQERISDNTRMSTIEIPIDQIKNIPALLGEKDVLKVIQLMPGVQKGSEGQSGFYVRGGGPDQNLILLDDATVYNANHLFGFFSIFNGDALKSVELTKGGFPARYGGRLSSVLEMRMKDGNKEKLHGEAGIGLLSSRITLEGPVKKGKSSFLVSGRRTYIDVISQPFILAANNGSMAGYFFYDFNAKYNHTIDSLNRIYVSGYFGKDKFYFRDRNGDDVSKGNFLWGNATGTVRWNHIHNEKMFSNTSLIFTDYSFGINFSEEFGDDFFELRYRSGIRDYSVKYDLEIIPNPNHYIRTGATFIYHRFSPSAVVLRGSDIEDNQDKVEKIPSYESAVYIEDDWSISDILKVNLGVRISQYYAGTKNYIKPEPRIAGRVMLNKNLSAKASYAIMNQYVHLLSNTGVGLPTDLWVPATEKVGPQQSQQWAAGFAKDMPKHGLMVSLEGYYKIMDGVINYRDGASFLDVGTGSASEQNDPLRWQDNVTTGSGESYGAEVLIQKKYGKLSGWIGYTLSWTKLQFDELNFGKEFFARYDRRHDISVVGIYKVNERMTLSATWVYGTGQAITMPLATFVAEQPSPSFNNAGSNISSGFMIAQDYGERNSFRMRAFHRMDIGAQWHKKLKRCERTFELGFYNLYNRRNPFYYYIETEYDSNGDVSNVLKQMSLFPILPSFTWTYKW